MHKALHSRDNIDRFYVLGKEGEKHSLRIALMQQFMDSRNLQIIAKNYRLQRLVTAIFTELT